MLVALRGDTRDTFQYLDVYWSLNEFPWNPIEFQGQFFMEWGFGLLAAIVKFAGFPPEVLFFLVSAMTFFAIAKASLAWGLEAWSAVPFYLSTFFLPQQFMQIRQGLAVALAFWAIALLVRAPRRWVAAIFITVAGALFHIVSLAPVLIAAVVLRFTPTRRTASQWLQALLVFGLIVAVCRAVSSLDVFTLIDRIGTYVNDEEYGASRSVFEPANLRAILLTLTFIAFRPTEERSWFRAYMLLLTLYVVHLGFRIGLIDFAILSGRLGSSLGFSEIFLLPLLIRDRVLQPLWSFVAVSAYVALHLAISLFIQLPFLVDDYLAPVHDNTIPAR